MPRALILPLQPLHDVQPPPGVGEYAHAAFFALLAQTDASLAERLHANADRKPFTLCPLLRNEARPRDEIVLRLTLLDDELLPALMTWLYSAQAVATIRLGAASYQITRVLNTPQAHPLAGNTTYRDLLKCPGRERLRVRFLTPTVFRSQKKDVLRPEPRLLWQSWVRAWNANAPKDTKEFREEARIVSLAEKSVEVTQAHIRVHNTSMIGGEQAGFVGECEFDLGSLTPPDRAALTTLAEFAFYAGTGRKTAMGMGQSWIVSAGERGV